MRREIRFLLGGVFTGLLLGVVTTLAIQYGNVGTFAVAGATTMDRRNVLPDANTASATGSQSQIQAGIADNLMGSAGNESNAALEIRVTRNANITFSAPFVKAVRELMAAGEPPEHLADLVHTEFDRLWSEERTVIENKLDSDESAEFYRSQNNTLHQAITDFLGENIFVEWDKQKSLPYFDERYALTAAESNALYRIVKDRDQRDTGLVRARDAGEIDPLDYEEQRKKSDEQFSQESSNVLASATVVEPPDDLPERLRAMTEKLNLTPQQLAELIEMERKHRQARKEFVPQSEVDPRANDPSDAANLRAVDAAAEQEWMRILGPQVYADFNKSLDNRYQAMKLYQKRWQLSDTDVNYLYQRFAQYDDAVEEHKAQAPQVPQIPVLTSAAQVDNFEKDLKEKLKADILPYLGEDRFRRFQAADIIPKDEDQPAAPD
jgi:hypothetical protein